ncbi:hypothetical protein LEP1GSC198_3794 [Leptospira kirschneri str. JB]|nr:hypothetical protein LEP1GSC198_0055 [Leptospira kirschneri str. JB]EMJ95293.1 hypothetical protein LEP1GSC198_3794 [Leptospira kirschneri str. JB]
MHSFNLFGSILLFFGNSNRYMFATRKGQEMDIIKIKYYVNGIQFLDHYISTGRERY